MPANPALCSSQRFIVFVGHHIATSNQNYDQDINRRNWADSPVSSPDDILKRDNTNLNIRPTGNVGVISMDLRYVSPMPGSFAAEPSPVLQ